MSNSTNHSAAIPFDLLLGLIGRSLSQGQRHYQVIDVIPEGPALVLRDHGPETGIQENQFGEPLRRAERLRTIPVYAIDGHTLNPVLAELTTELMRGDT